MRVKNKINPQSMNKIIKNIVELYSILKLQILNRFTMFA